MTDGSRWVIRGQIYQVWFPEQNACRMFEDVLGREGVILGEREERITDGVDPLVIMDLATQ